MIAKNDSMFPRGGWYAPRGFLHNALMTEIEPIHDIYTWQVMTCPACGKKPGWHKDSFECPTCQFGRNMKLWSLSRWNRAVESADENTRKMELRRHKVHTTAIHSLKSKPQA